MEFRRLPFRSYPDQVARYPYDPAKAKQLLAEAGYPSGFPAIFWIPESGSGMQSPKTMAQAIQADLAVVGIKVQIQTFEWGAYLNQYGKGFETAADMGRSHSCSTRAIPLPC